MYQSIENYISIIDAISTYLYPLLEVSSNIGPIMLNFDVSYVVNQNKLLRNSRIAGDMGRSDSCDATVLEVPKQIDGPLPPPPPPIKVQWPNSIQARVIQIAIVHNDTHMRRNHRTVGSCAQMCSHTFRDHIGFHCHSV